MVTFHLFSFLYLFLIALNRLLRPGFCVSLIRRPTHFTLRPYCLLFKVVLGYYFGQWGKSSLSDVVSVAICSGLDGFKLPLPGGARRVNTKKNQWRSRAKNNSNPSPFHLMWWRLLSFGRIENVNPINDRKWPFDTEDYCYQVCHVSDLKHGFCFSQWLPPFPRMPRDRPDPRRRSYSAVLSRNVNEESAVFFCVVLRKRFLLQSAETQTLFGYKSYFCETQISVCHRSSVFLWK